MTQPAKNKEFEVQIMRNKVTLTSSIWVGSRSVSIMCPMLSSPPRIYLDAEWFKLVHQKKHLGGCCDGLVCASSSGHCAKSSFHKDHICVFAPLCEFWSVCATRPTWIKDVFEKKWNFPKNILTWWTSWHSRANCKDRAGPQCASAGELSGEKSSCRSFHSWDSGTGAW